jgi:hypothetical protein
MATGGVNLPSEDSRAAAEELINNMELFRSMHTIDDLRNAGAKSKVTGTIPSRETSPYTARRYPDSSTPQPFDFQRQYAETSQRLVDTQLELARIQRDFIHQQHELTELKNKPTTDKLMPMKYSGKTDFDEYESQFEAIAGLQNWDDDRKAVVLLSKLEGQALTVATAEPRTSYKDLVDCLKENFSPEQQTIFAMKLNSRVQGKDETYEALANDVKRLTKKAYSTADSQTRERLATDAFVNAIADDCVREKLRDKTPSSVTEALKSVRQIAVNREIEKQRVKQTARRVEASSSNENDGDRKLQNKIAKLEAELKQFQSERPKMKQPRLCYFCSLPGHVKKFCPFDPANHLLPSCKVQMADTKPFDKSGNGKGQTS